MKNNRCVFCFNRLNPFLALCFFYVAIAMVRPIFRFDLRLWEDWGEILFASFFAAVFAALGYLLLIQLTFIRVDEKGMSSRQFLFRSLLISWEEVREIGLSVSKAKYSFYSEVYISKVYLSDYDRVCRQRFFRNGIIHFPYASSFDPRKGPSAGAKSAILRHYPGVLPPEFRTLTDTPCVSCIIRSEKDGEATSRHHFLQGSFADIRSTLQLGQDSPNAIDRPVNLT